jgi:hypothetical protein
VDDKHLWCQTPAVPIPLDKLKGDKSKALAYGFVLDGVASLQNLTALSYEDHRMIEVYEDPQFEVFDNGRKVHQQKNELLVIDVSTLDILVHIVFLYTF